MANHANTPSKTPQPMSVKVAVAVIHYQDHYLLGFRNSSQHQGNRYEFVGGKIDTAEAPIAALIREVDEETGIDVSHNTKVKLGRLHHDYGDKKVSLHVYKIALTAEQYQQHQHQDKGLEGQTLTWVTQHALLAGDYLLPAANRTILTWLQIPEQIAITYPLAHFSQYDNPAAAWLKFYQQHIPSITSGTWVYLRIKSSDLSNAAPQPDESDMVKSLITSRPDIGTIVPCALQDTSQGNPQNQQIKAYHLTQTELMHWFLAHNRFLANNRFLAHNRFLANNSHAANAVNSTASVVPFEAMTMLSQPLIISCHDTASILAANKLADARIQQHLPPVIGIFLSPVLSTQTHPDTVPLGWTAWLSLAQLADMPVIGLGGLSPMMRDKATEHGASSIAGIRQFLLC